MNTQEQAHFNSIYQSYLNELTLQGKSTKTIDSYLTYLARYLYRGVISENNILALNNDEVTFEYKPSKSKTFKTITEHVCKFLWRIMQHVLPKGFRRARNYGFYTVTPRQP
jgi:hypothetical protein